MAIEGELKRILEETYTASIQYGNMYSQGAYHMATILATKFLDVATEDILHLEREQAERLWHHSLSR